MPTSAYADALAAAGQGHVVAAWDDLSPAQQQLLDAQLSMFDFQQVNRIFAASLEAEAATAKDATIAPPQAEDVTNFDDAAVRQGLFAQGLSMVQRGQCAVVVLAGGQGTRLGSPVPKGLVRPQHLPSGSSLFQLICEKVRKVEALAEASNTIHLCIMTSQATHQDTKDFLYTNNYFGLASDHVHLFMQGSMPCVTPEGKIIMERPHVVAAAPNGNAGIYPALAASGTLQVLENAGVTHVQIVTVDNLLTKIADPAFYGACAAHGADAAAKTTPKAHPHEAVGVFATRGGKWGVVEYSEIGKERAESTNDDGSLKFNASNVAIHCCTVSFLQRVASLFATGEFCTYHVARKQIPSLSTEGKDDKVPGIKLEAFIFDLFAYAFKFLIVQVDRAAEFAPIKNAVDKASVDNERTAVQALSDLHSKWLRAAGVEVEADASGAAADPPRFVEVSPLLSYEGEGLDRVKAAIGEKVLPPCHIKLPSSP